MKVGQLVEVRSRLEILATLDDRGQLDGMPFMPEMFAFCGQRHRIYRSAHKTCDTVFPVRSRKLSNVVHLETRCSGAAHGGCEAACLLFWNTAWLKPVEDGGQPPSPGSDRRETPMPTDAGGNSDESTVLAGTRLTGPADEADPVYVCQATQLPYASQDLSPYDARQYVRDLTSGNVTFGQWLRGLIYITMENLINLGIGWGPVLRWLYDFVQKLWGGLPYPRTAGKISMGLPTPSMELNLQPGELVRVKSFEQILATCNVDNKNRGMGFDAEQMPYCGHTYRVKQRVTRIINERSGRMMVMKNPCIILEDVFCRGRYSHCRMFCGRSIYSYWREIWLERV
jgi:hypothetical protein